MTVRYTERARNHIDTAFTYGVEHFGEAVAVRTYRRLIHHVETVLSAYPRTGRWRDDISCFSAWVPRTPFIVFYRIETTGIVVLAVFHHARVTAAGRGCDRPSRIASPGHLEGGGRRSYRSAAVAARSARAPSDLRMRASRRLG